MKKILLAIIAIIAVLLLCYTLNNRESDVDFLEGQLEQIGQHFDQRTVINQEVSSVTVAWHLDHMLKTINNVSQSLERSDPNTFESSFNIQQVVVHTTGIIPRGVAKSPKSVLPPDVILLDSLKLQLASARKNLSKIEGLDENAFYAHTVFDNLDRDQTRRFLEIHTNHHLKIIADIIKK